MTYCQTPVGSDKCGHHVLNHQIGDIVRSCTLEECPCEGYTGKPLTEVHTEEEIRTGITEPHSHSWEENCGSECPRHHQIELPAPEGLPYGMRMRMSDPPCPTQGCPSPVAHEGDCNVPPERKTEARIEITPQGTKVYDVDGDLVEPSSWKIGPARIMEKPGKTVAKYVDEAMFTATPIDAATGPKVYLLNMTPDPLGAIAAACKGYEGRFVHDLSEITDEERLRYFEQVQKTHLRAPFEFVHFHFLIEGVTRGFTHQMVRQRTATYVQESTRFAVKDQPDGLPVGLPPSLAGTTGVWRQHEEAARGSLEHADGCDDCERIVAEELAEAMVRGSDAERQRWSWDLVQDRIEIGYKNLVATGLPAEDARGLLPTNLLTRIQYRTDLKSLIEHGGNRLCTQAQFEWRTVFSKIVEAIRNAENTGINQTTNFHNVSDKTVVHRMPVHMASKIADVFRPICYLTGKCEFKADFDRKCSIRERVDKFAEHGVPSSEWGPEKCDFDHECAHSKHGINAIQPAEWLLDPGAAR